MSLAEVRKALGDRRAHLAPQDSVPINECAYLKSNRVPETMGLMFSEGRVVRIDVWHPGIRTLSGIGVGDSDEKLQRLYQGRLKLYPEQNSPETGHDLIFLPNDPSDRGFGMVFELIDGKVSAFRTGTLAAIALVEGCL